MINLKPAASREEFDRVWVATQAHILQSWEWGEVKSATWKTNRSIITIEGKEVGVLNLMVRSLFGIKMGYIPKLKVPDGIEPKELFEVIKDAKDNNGIDFAIIEPDHLKGSLSIAGLQLSTNNVQPAQSNCVQLNKTEQELFAGLKSKYRRNIKKSERDGVKVAVFQQGEKALTDFYSVMKEIFANTKFVMHDFSYFQKVWQNLSQTGKAEILLAHLESKIVGAYLVAYDELGAYEFYGGVTRAGRDVEAGYLLKWKAMINAKQKGKAFYDHWGVAKRFENGEYDNSSELYQISKFKEGFGGNYVEYVPAIVLVKDKFRYRLFNVLERLQQLRLRLTKILRG